MASPEVFVDTSGLYALVEKNDAHHARARSTVEKLLHAGRKLVLTDYRRRDRDPCPGQESVISAVVAGHSVMQQNLGAIGSALRLRPGCDSIALPGVFW